MKRAALRKGEVVLVKKIGFITTNKVLAQSLVTIIKGYPELEVEPLMLLNREQTLLDAETLKIDAAVIDMTAGYSEESGMVRELFETLHKTLPECKILLLVSQDDMQGRETAIKAVKQNAADDFIFYDSSLDYLLIKLLTLLKVPL